MKALGVVLVPCCAAVFWPAAAHANPIGIRECATIESTAASSWQAFTSQRDGDDGLMTAGAGLDHSARFGATGTVAVFDDDHESLGGAGTAASAVTTAGSSTASSTASHTVVTLAPGTSLVGSGNNGNDNNQGQGHAYAYAYGHDHAASDPAPSDPPSANSSGDAPPMPQSPKASDPPSGGGATTSATPEPAPLLLLATGLAGLIVFRRQLFA